ncbi:MULTISPECIES: MFS transporter [Streptomyces]|uniref:MFS transporter n=1 Tax=Streptomyces venezuelae TaxID=54571 RepID=A0A5P2AMC3_STRVZ|nr:MFS transporter [Streptomyces venezuelae]QES17991.1 hypothetical protein DEJ46_01825 [Streptomyces venezuelae]
MNSAPSPHSPEHSPARPSDPALLRRVALSSLLGTVIEYYDFLLYGTMAALVFGPLFFPESDPGVATIAAFGTLAAGYVSRPLGGAVFGQFGDRFSAVLLAVGRYVRVSITESPLFRQAAARTEGAGRELGLPQAQVLRRPRNLVLACAVGIGPFALTALISTYMLTYATAIGYATSEVMTGLVLTSVTGPVTIPLFSALSDRVGRRAVVLGGAAGVVLLAFPVYALVDARSPALLVLGMVLGQVVQSAMYAPLGPLLSELFGTRVRYTGASLGYQLAALIGGGFTPLFASSLLSDGARSAPLAVLALVCGLVTALAVWRTAETRGRDLSEEDPAPPSRIHVEPMGKEQSA